MISFRSFPNNQYLQKQLLPWDAYALGQQQKHIYKQKAHLQAKVYLHMNRPYPDK